MIKKTYTAKAKLIVEHPIAIGDVVQWKKFRSSKGKVIAISEKKGVTIYRVKHLSLSGKEYDCTQEEIELNGAHGLI